MSAAGILILLGIAWAFSRDRKRFPARVVAGGLLIQLALAAFIFTVPAGTKFFLFLNETVVQILNCATSGAKFVFGRLALAPGQTASNGETSLGFILAFQAFPTIVFFSALVSVLYYLNVMPALIRGFAFFFTRLMRVSGAESLVAASNIFVGIESALTVKPHLARMTQSELCTVLTAGMATVSSSVLVLYVLSLQSVFPTIVGHLISASLLNAPAALMMSKILLPESGVPETLGTQIEPHYEKEAGIFEAVIQGAHAGVKMIVGIVAMLIAVLGFVALFDLAITGLGVKINAVTGWVGDWSLRGILGFVFYPLTIILGVAPEDAGGIARILGERLILTEVVSYQDLAAAVREGLIHEPRSMVIATYALCGFAHLPSMAIFVGGISALAPGRMRDIAGVAWRALVAATMACLLSACVAGIFFREGSVLVGT